MACVLGDIADWQAALERTRDKFEGLATGACIGVLPLGDGAAPITQVDGDMLVWTVNGAGAEARMRPFPGFPVDGIDLLFAADDAVLEDVTARLADDPIAELMDQVAAGLVLLFYLKGREDLEALGYEAFFEHLGIAFMGACR